MVLITKKAQIIAFSAGDNIRSHAGNAGNDLFSPQGIGRIAKLLFEDPDAAVAFPGSNKRNDRKNEMRCIMILWLYTSSSVAVSTGFFAERCFGCQRGLTVIWIFNNFDDLQEYK